VSRSGGSARLILLIVAAAVVIRLLAGSGSIRLGPPARAAPPAVHFGTNVNYLYDYRDMSPAQIDAQLASLRATGATIARTDAGWESAEPAPPVNGVHTFDWSFDDQIVGSLAGHGIRWEPIVDYVAGWAESQPGQTHSPPISDADYAAFARALALRYGLHGTFWHEHPSLPYTPTGTYEIWNEPDTRAFWSPAPDPAAYAELYLAARNAIKSVEPRSRVIVGGLVGPRSFVAGMLAAIPGLRTRIEGVAIHPYGPSPAVVLGNVELARAGLDALGMTSTPLYVNEFGWATEPPGGAGYLPAAQRPPFIERTLAELAHSGCGLAAIELYTWLTPRRDLSDNEDWYGISPASAGPSADVSAFAAGLRAGGGTSSSGAVCRSSSAVIR
jgi:hypothetical protein